jgi:hypothetical protein
MWEKQKESRFQQLREREVMGALTQAEQGELASLFEELNAIEAASLAPATDRLRQERETVEAQNRTLEILAQRKEILVRRLRDFLCGSSPSPYIANVRF